MYALAATWRKAMNAFYLILKAEKNIFKGGFSAVLPQQAGSNLDTGKRKRLV